MFVQNSLLIKNIVNLTPMHPFQPLAANTKTKTFRHYFLQNVMFTLAFYFT
jgi:hypothetical protein